MLHQAASGGDTDIISLIHTHLPNIESKTGQGEAPRAVKWFLEKGATVLCKDKKGWNTLHYAAQSGDTDTISLIHTHLPNIESKTGDGYTPLMVAAFTNNLDAVKWFLEKGAAVNTDNVQVVKSVIKRGADPSLMDNTGWNTLHLAAVGGDTDIISLIHTHLPNIESKTDEGYTPLMAAAVSGKLHAVQWFVEKGATVTFEDARGLNALHYAVLGGDTDTISLILTYLPDIESKTADGHTPLIMAVLKGTLSSVQFFKTIPKEESQSHVDKLYQNIAISLKHMNDPNERYVAVLVLGCLWHETI